MESFQQIRKRIKGKFVFFNSCRYVCVRFFSFEPCRESNVQRKIQIGFAIECAFRVKLCAIGEKRQN